MRVTDVSNTIVSLYNIGKITMYGRESLLFLGPPGIGKSETMRAAAIKIAKSLGREFIVYNDDVADEILADPEKYFVYVDLRLTECEPSDLGGIPEHFTTVNGLKTVQFAPLLWARVLNQNPGMLVLDEITNVQRPDVISASYKLFYDRRAGHTEFHKDVMIVAAGNSPEHSSVANKLPLPLVSRVGIYDVAPPRVDDWAKYMTEVHGDDWDRRVYSFLKRFEDEKGIFIGLPKEPETLDPYPVPRSWTALSVLMSQGFTDRETMDARVGKEASQKLYAYLKINIDIDDLLKKPEMWRTVNPDAKYMASIMLSTWLTKNKKNVKKAFPLIDEMFEDSSEFITLAAVPMSKKDLIKFLTDLFKYDTKYKDAFKEIALEVKTAISV